MNLKNALVYVVTRNIQGDIPWCMLFADVVLVDESLVGVNRKLEL